MNLYIQRVLEANSLFAEAERLNATGEGCVHTDRHVELPRTDESRDIVQDACLAGIRLLEQWQIDRGKLMQSGFLISEPVLVIDDEWMDQMVDPPPPHVCISIAKDASKFVPLLFADNGGNDLELFPLRELLAKEIGPHRVVRVRANPNPPFEEIGFWLIM